MGTEIPRWDDLDPETRAALDAQYVKEFEKLAEPGVPVEAIEAYLAYRHERPAGQITTVEQGHVRHLLHRMRDRDAIADPVATEEHRDAVERFGAGRLRLTNSGTFLAILFAHVYVGLLAALIWLLVRAG